MSVSNPTTSSPLPKDLTIHLRRLSRHLTSVQSRSASPRLLFAQLPPNASPPPSEYAPAHDPYDLKSHPSLPLQAGRLSSNVERAYVVVIPVYAGFVGEVGRLATWKDPVRTGIWAGSYVVLWWFGMIVPAGLGIFLALCIWPSSASGILFPAEPKGKGKGKGKDKNPKPTAVGPVDPFAEQLGDAAPSGSTPDEAEVLAEEEEVLEVRAEAFAEELSSFVSTTVPASGSADAGPACATVVSPQIAGIASSMIGGNSKSGGSNGKPKKKKMAEVYRPLIVQHGATAQRVAGDIADAHERWRNLFLGRFCAPPGSSEAKERFPPNVRFAIPVIPILLASLCLSTETMGRLVTLVMGLLLFALHPAQKRFEAVRDALDADRTVLRGVPTDQGWVLAVLRDVYRREGMEAMSKLLGLAATKEDGPTPPEISEELSRSETNPEVATPTTETTASASASAVSSPSIATVRKRDKFAAFARKALEVTEQSSELITGQRSVSLANIAALIPAPGESYSSSTARDRVLRALAPTRPAGEEHVAATSFFCYHGGVPGHLMIYPPKARTETPEGGEPRQGARLTFHSGIGLSFKARKETMTLPLDRVVGMRKTRALGMTGVWGGLEGLELVEEGPDGKRWSFGNIFRRDEAFLRMLVMREWEEGEDAGWVAA